MNYFSNIQYKKIKFVFLLLSLVILQSCGGGGTSPAAVVKNDNLPEQFIFADIGNSTLNTEIYSNFIIVKGIDVPTPISITGGEYAITGVNGTSFTSEAGTIKNGQRFQVRLTTSTVLGELHNVVLTIGDKTDTFSVKNTENGLAVKLTPSQQEFSENGGIGSFTIELTSKPNGTVDIDLINLDRDEVTLDTELVSFTTTSWNKPQTIKTIAVNDKVLDGTQTVIISLSINPSSTDTTGYKKLTKLELPTETITILDNGVAGVTATAFGATTVSENGGILKFDVKLNSQPTPGSVIDIALIGSPANTSVLPMRISFNSNDWATTKRVQLISTSDKVVTGDLIFPISFNIVNITNSTNNVTDVTGYTVGDKTQPINVTLTNADSNPGVSVTILGSSSLTETNGPNSFVDVNIVLLSKPVSSADPINSPSDVVINVVSSTVTRIDKTQLRFTDVDWDIAQRIRISTIDDKIYYGLNPTVVKLSVLSSNDNRYIALLNADVPDINVTVTDNDIAKVILSSTVIGNIKEGKTKSFTVKLNSQPINRVVIDLAVSDSTQASLDKTSLVFTDIQGDALNWQNTQTVTVLGLNDGVVIADDAINIKINLTLSGTDVDYNSGLNRSVTATIINTEGTNSSTDGGGFLQFLNKSSPRNKESAATGNAYYTAIDPNNKRLTLEQFKTFNRLKAGLDSDGNTNLAVYVNDFDLGFGRRMYLNVNKKTTGAVTRVASVASCVENYAPGANVNSSVQDKLNLAHGGLLSNIIATVCMEYSGTPGAIGATFSGDLPGRKYVKFFSYLSDGTTRISQVDLDGRGVKTQPGLCNSCHGGQSNSLVNGIFPNNGDTGAKFLPWDLDTLIYAEDQTLSVIQNMTLNNQARSSLEAVLKRFNQGVLATFPQPQTFSFRGNVIIPKLGPNAIDPVSGRVVTPSVLETSIDVSGVVDVITNLIVSIDEDSQGLPGISFPTVQALKLELITPTGQVLFLKNGTTGVTGQNVAGSKKLYFSDDANSSRGDVNEVGPRIVNNLMTGTSLLTNRGITNYKKCDPSVIPPTIPDDISCSIANGRWTLRIKNNSYKYIDATTSTVIDATMEGILRGWSLHFNGVPDGAYIPATVELVRGWYGGKNLPNAIFDSQFVPSGWKSANNPGAVANTETLYLDVIASTCRACHAQRGNIGFNDLDFSTYTKFMSYAARTKSLVYDKGLMPSAKRTYENHFWNSTKPTILAKHMPVDVTGLQPGRNTANAGIDRTGTLAVRIGDTVKLNGNGSLFATAFNWTIRAPNGAQIVVTNPTTATPSFIVAQTGSYTATLITSGISPVTSSKTIIVDGSISAPAAISFITNIIGDNAPNAPVDTSTKAVYRSCLGSRCHDRNFRELDRLTYADADASPADKIDNYRIIRDRVDTLLPLDSLMIRKGLDTLRHGSIGKYNNGAYWHDTGVGIEREKYDIFLRWILEGALNN